MDNFYDVIYKYELKPDDNIINIPQNAKIISAESQNNNVVIYALVNKSENRTKEVMIRVFGTGHIINTDILTYTFLNTIKMYNDSLVFHIFYKYL